MSKENNGGPAFPVAGVATKEGYKVWTEPGISTRDYFAAKAMQAMLGLSEVGGDYVGYNETCDWPGIAKHAYAMADAMIAERAK